MTISNFYYLYLLISLFMVSCDQPNIEEMAIIKLSFSSGSRISMNGKKMYLSEINNSLIKDSAIVKENYCEFKLLGSRTKLPAMVWIRYEDTFNNTKFLRPVGFRNPFMSSTINSSFYLDTGITIIAALGLFDRLDSSYISTFSGSRQNIPFLKGIALKYAKADTSHIQLIVSENIQTITRYPYSVELLRQLYSVKEYFSETSLKSQLSCFESEIKGTKMFRSFEDFFLISENYEKWYPSNVLMENANGDLETIKNDNSKYNLIVFWASWCGPCRREIPELKKIYSQFNNKGLNITSVSLDAGKPEWKSALEKENMPWKQLIALNTSKEKLESYYNLSSIPKAYLFDKNAKLVEKFEGSNSSLIERVNTLMNNK